MFLAVPLIIGAFCVLQNTMNRRLAPTLGLDWALFVNGCVCFVCGTLLMALVRFLPGDLLPPIFRIFRPVAGSRSLAAYDLLPGIFGFCIISGLPWAIERMGATKVFIGVIASQLVVSIAWDIYVEGLKVSAWRLAGGALAIAGTVLATL